MGDEKEFQRDKLSVDQSYYQEISNSIRSLFELTTRIDERVGMMMKRQESTDGQLAKVVDKYELLMNRLATLEANSSSHDQSLAVDNLKDQVNRLENKMSLLEMAAGRQENRWKTIGSFIIQIIWVIVAAWLLYKLGIQAPAVP